MSVGQHCWPWGLSAHLWTLPGDRQNSSSVVSFLLLHGTSSCFLSTAPLLQGFTLASHRVPPHLLLHKQRAEPGHYFQGPAVHLHDWLHLANNNRNQTETLKMTQRNPERRSSQYGKQDSLVLQMNYAHNWLPQRTLGPYQLWDSQTKWTHRSFSSYAESSFEILPLMQSVQCYLQPLKLCTETRPHLSHRVCSGHLT